MTKRERKTKARRYAVKLLDTVEGCLFSRRKRCDCIKNTQRVLELLAQDLSQEGGKA